MKMRLLVLLIILVEANAILCFGSGFPSIVRPVQQEHQSLKNMIKVSYTLDRDRLSLHEPVVLTFSVNNKLGVPITLDLGRWGSGLIFLGSLR